MTSSSSSTTAAMEEDRVAKTFDGRSVFITGGTGFLGKVLIEKILRVCPDVAQIYLLVRTKRGKEPSQRLHDIFSNALFDGLKKSHGLPFLTSKCSIMSGDCASPELGMSTADQQTIIDRVSVVFHCAATIRFDETLKKAVLLNTRGTKCMLDLARQMKCLDLFCHVSTAYCHLHERHLQEKAYPPPADPHKIIKAIEWMDEEIVDSMTDKILGDLPNTYAFTKSLGEALVVEQIDSIPVVVLRPSIVIPIYQDPIPGWTDNINGPTGLLIGAGKGVIRTMYCDSDGYGDYLPVDIAVNCMLLATWNFLENGDRSRRIYNVCSSSEIKVSWNQIIEMGREIVSNKVPLNGVMWYPGGGMTTSRLYHRICLVLYHFIPAIFIDALLFCLGYKPVLMRVHKRICKGFEVFEYYANNQWDFDNSNIRYLRTVINETERAKYKIDAEGLDMMKYFEVRKIKGLEFFRASLEQFMTIIGVTFSTLLMETFCAFQNCIMAARLYILNEPTDTLPAARRHMRIMWWVDKICKTLIIGAFLYYTSMYCWKMFT